MSLQSVPGSRIGGRLARLRCWTLRTKLATALALVGTMPTLLTVYIGHVPWWIVAAPLLVVGLMTTLLMRLLMAPIMSLKATIERVQAGDFTARSGIDQRDEIGEIAVAFDAMTERAQALQHDCAGHSRHGPRGEQRHLTGRQHRAASLQ